MEVSNKLIYTLTEVKVADIENLIKIKKLSGRQIDLIDIEELTKELNKKND
jgi:hypothetical protein